MPTTMPAAPVRGKPPALDPDAAFQLILAATEAAWARLREMAPDLARWPVVPMPPLTDDELLPIWLCQRPYIEDILGERIDLRRLLPLPPDRLRRLFAAVDPHDLIIPEHGHAVRLREAGGPGRRGASSVSTPRSLVPRPGHFE